ncbi:F-box protein [Striga hermonthica]|uniref:F-box protein n=1 Tax=Striga hermonthica TaxID=68872 RepID=A0A9N7NA54_STRHE|nr:F-box protein [Striga hermonthica]
MSIKKKTLSPKVESVEVSHEMSVLDLPDLVLESILERLPPNELFKVANVCSVLRCKCLSDHLWEMHIMNKWGRAIGPAAYKEWRRQIVSRKGSIFSGHGKNKGQMVGYYNLVDLWPLELIRSSFSNIFKKNNFPPAESMMSCYLAIESGNFWFPAQVYNRENGHVGFMLSCYDAMVSYDRRTNTFQARYPEHGTRPTTVETGVTLDRLRAKPVDTSSHDLYLSTRLDELKPGDHIEIQWRRNREFPYGWWYGVVGHLETCDGSAGYCRCHDRDTLVLEFNQYAQGSRWRRTLVNRKDHREKGNDVDGFYGGIRKLYGNEEILKWKKLWPAEVFE